MKKNVGIFCSLLFFATIHLSAHASKSPQKQKANNFGKTIISELLAQNSVLKSALDVANSTTKKANEENIKFLAKLLEIKKENEKLEKKLELEKYINRKLCKNIKQPTDEKHIPKKDAWTQTGEPALSIDVIYERLKQFDTEYSSDTSLSSDEEKEKEESLDLLDMLPSDDDEEEGEGDPSSPSASSDMEKEESDT